MGCAVGLLLAVQARAGEPHVDAGPPPRGVEAITVHGEEVHGASFSLPMGGEEISAQRIARLPATSAAGIVAYLPGIRVQQRVQGEDAAVSIDGLPPEYSKLLLNGLRYAGEIGAVGDLADLPIAGVERIEVLRGPQALRYGPDAAGGVVNVVTAPAPAEPGARLELDSRMGDQGLIHATHAGAARLGNLGATWNLLHDQIDGFEPRGSDFLQWAGPDSRKNIEDAYSTFDYTLGETTRLLSDLGWRFEREDLAFTEGDRTERREYTRQLASLGVEHTTAGGMLGRGQARFFSGDTDSEVGRPFRMREREWSLDAGIERELQALGEIQSLHLGLDAELPAIELDESGLSPEYIPEGAEDVNSEVYAGSHADERFAIAGLSARWEAPLANWATLDLGLRSQLHSEFDDRVLPQAALLLRPADSVRVRLAWGLGYRTPSLRELYQPAVSQNGGNYFLAGNPDLKAESSSGWRLGLEYDPSSWIQLATTFFSNSLDDHIRSVSAGDIALYSQMVQRDLPTDPRICIIDPTRCLTEQLEQKRAPLFRKANLDRVRTRGIEAQVLLEPAPRLSLRLGYTLLHTSLDSNLIGADELPNEPPHTVDLEGTVSLPQLETELTLRARWRDQAIPERSGTGSASFQDPSALTDRSWVLDLRLRQPLREGLELYLDGTNLTDTKSVDSYEIRPRLLCVGVTLRFEDL
jgi:outer membrane receptor for ferrienterochelin and colicins